MLNLHNVERKAELLNKDIEGKTSRFVIVFCSFNTTKIFWLYVGIFMLLQLIARQLEIAINGEPQLAIYDPVIAIILISHYLVTTRKMTKYLMKLAVSSI
jgi:hypothetical protein